MSRLKCWNTLCRRWRDDDVNNCRMTYAHNNVPYPVCLCRFSVIDSDGRLISPSLTPVELEEMNN